MGGLTEGNYSISLSVDNAGGVARYDDVVTISVLSVPIQINIDSESVDVGSLQIGEIATASNRSIWSECSQYGDISVS